MKVLDDVAVALYPLQVLVPAIGLVAIHVVQQPAVPIAAQQRLHFTGTTVPWHPRPGESPAWIIMMGRSGCSASGAVAQPLQQLVPIRGLHQACSLSFFLRGRPMSHRQQVQVGCRARSRRGSPVT